MASIKAAVAQDIVDSIIADVKQETDDINNRLVEMLDTQIDEYRSEKTQQYEIKVQKVREDRQKIKLKMESELRFDVSQKLRQRRSELFESFNEALKKDVIEFMNSPEYPAYLNSIIKKYAQNGDKILIRQEDFDKVDTHLELVPKALEMGGVMIETTQTIRDFSLESRYKDALQTFIAKSNVNI